MNNNEHVIKEIEEFLNSDTKIALVTGTNQINKHKLVMSFLDNYYKNKYIIFRTNTFEHLTNRDLIGFFGLKKTPKSGEKIRLNNNIYEFDTINKITWYRSGKDFDFGIIYPFGIFSKEKSEAFEQFIKTKKVKKLFLITCQDRNLDGSILDNYEYKHIVYDIEE